MKGQTIKGIAGIIGFGVLAGAASSVGSHLVTKGIEKAHTLKARLNKKRKHPRKNVKKRIIEFKKEES